MDRQTINAPQYGKGMIKAGQGFCMETSMHGFNHIAAEGRHWLERFIWVGVIAAAIWGTVGICLDQWKRFNENPTVVTLEKNFRAWNFPLPGVTACSENKSDPRKVREAIKKLWSSVPGDDKYTYYSEFVDTVVNYDLFHGRNGNNPFQKYAHDHTLDIDLFQLAVDVAPDLNIKVTLSSESLLSWTRVMTESGVCHITNSLAAADIALDEITANDTNNYPLRCKYIDACYMMFEITNNTLFNFHSPYDVSDTLSSPSAIRLAWSRKYILNVLETHSGAGVEELSVRRRGCLTLNEASSSRKQVYSSSMCRRACRNNLAVKLCGCRPFYYFYEDGPACLTAGMACLVEHARILIHPSCSCMLQCVDAVFMEVSSIAEHLPKGPIATRGYIRYTVQAPRDRYTREIVFHFQDLVVSFGGATGLFLGASFLSFVEIFYYMIKRFFNTFVGTVK